VETADVPESRIDNCTRQVHQAAKRARIPVKEAYPSGADEETRQFVRYRFDVCARKQLTALSRASREVRDKKTRNFLWCALSRMVIAKDAGVSLVRDVSHSRPHKWFTRSPAEPFDIFESALSRVLASSLFRGVQSNPKVRIQRGDARRLPLEQACIFVPALQRWLEDQVESPRPPQPANSKESSALTDDSFSLPSLTAANETFRLRERASEVCRSEACTVGTA
jgi:hypothetical protein